MHAFDCTLTREKATEEPQIKPRVIIVFVKCQSSQTGGKPLLHRALSAVGHHSKPGRTDARSLLAIVGEHVLCGAKNVDGILMVVVYP